MSSPVEGASGPRIMFEVYREGAYDRRFRVCYFTELGEQERDRELNRCLAGESFLAGYLARGSRRESRAIIADALARLNDGEAVAPGELRSLLASHLV